jgi:hypothetical protein
MRPGSGVLAALLCMVSTSLGASRENAAVFSLSIAGLPIGSALLAFDRDGDRYVIEGAADIGFLFWGGNGVARTEGRVSRGALQPERYRLSYDGVSRPGAVRIDFDKGAAVGWERRPPIPPEFAKGREEVRPDDLVDVLDPLSALVAPLGPDAPASDICDRVVPVFSGYTRFDLELVGSSGQGDGVVTCDIRYRAVSGHRRDSDSVRRLQRPGALGLTMAPIGADAWAPARLTFATRFGVLEIARRD